MKKGQDASDRGTAGASSPGLAERQFDPLRPTVRTNMHFLARTMVSLFLVALTSCDAGAHGGGLNAEGCHHNRKTGDYHCHRGGAARSEPRRLSFSSQYSGGAFRNCDAARAAGAAPVYQGDPGYGAHLDRDNDGVGCEPYRGR
jgi:hypothetical protein